MTIHPTSTGRLLVIVSETVSEWIEKGEVVDRYYNPGDRFDDVHLLLLNDDSPDPGELQRLVGSARLTLHNLPTGAPRLARTLTPRPALGRRQTERAVRLAREIAPDLVRCYGAGLNGLCALEIRRVLRVPIVVSLHTLPDDSAYPPVKGRRQRAEMRTIRRVRERVLREADLVLAVYRSLVPYLERIGARRIEVAYSVLNAAALRVKDDYQLHDPVRVLCVGRQIPGKDPRALLQAIADRQRMELDLIGDGSLHSAVNLMVAESGVGERVRVRRAVTNDDIVAMLPDYDIFAVHNDYQGIPKAVLEPMLSGLPVLINRGAYGSVPEITDEVALIVEGTPEGYGAGLDSLIAEGALREQLGRAGRAWAESACAPARAEARIVALYDDLLIAPVGAQRHGRGSSSIA